MMNELSAEKSLINNSSNYRTIIGKLLYLSNWLRIDLYIVSYLSRFTNLESKEIWTITLNIMKYLAHYIEDGILFAK